MYTHSMCSKAAAVGPRGHLEWEIHSHENVPREIVVYAASRPPRYSASSNLTNVCETPAQSPGYAWWHPNTRFQIYESFNEILARSPGSAWWHTKTELKTVTHKFWICESFNETSARSPGYSYWHTKTELKAVTHTVLYLWEFQWDACTESWSKVTHKVLLFFFFFLIFGFGYCFTPTDTEAY
jgi:hypothetical protein